MAASVISSTAKWKEFFQRYYKKQIQELAVSGTRYKALVVEYPDINRYDVRLAEELKENPDLCLAHAEEALGMVDLPIKKEVEARVRILHMPVNNLRIRDIKNQHINQLARIKCMVRNISKTDRRRIVEAAFECARCKNIIVVPQEGAGKFIEPTYCSCRDDKKGVFRLLYKESRFEEFQRIRVQELTEDLDGGADPLHLDIQLSDDLTQQVAPGEKITITGVLRTAQRIKANVGKTCFFDDYMDGNSIERSERSYEDIKPTTEEENQIRHIATGKNPLADVVSSIAPAITGMDEVKEGVAHLLFDGVRKPLPDGTWLRGDIHALLVGDGGTGKSKILDHVTLLVPRVMQVEGSGASGAGLTAATVPDDFGEGYTLEAGALVLADQGICVWDEIEKTRKDELKKVYPSMERQEIIVDRAGIHARMRAECSILAAGNPKSGKWDAYDSIGEQIGMDAPMLSRFDLIYIIQDKPDPVRDEKIATGILKAHKAGQLRMKHEHRVDGVTREMADEAAVSIKPRIPEKLLRKYVALGRQCYPELTQDASEILLEYYLRLRKATGGDKSPLQATARNMDGLVRLSEAAARMRLSNTITADDAKQAVRVHEYSLKNSGTDPETGQVDISWLTAGIGKAQKDRMKDLRKTIEKISRENNGLCSIVALEEAVVTDRYPADKLAKDLKKLKEIGEVFEPKTGFVQNC